MQPKLTLVNEEDVVTNVDNIFSTIKKLNYSVLEHKFSRNIDDFDLAKDKKKCVKSIYNVYHYEKDLHIVLVELTKMTDKLITYITKKLHERYINLLLIFAAD